MSSDTYPSKKAILYARVSSDIQVDNYSIPTQLAACQGYAQGRGYEIVGEVFDDISGAEIDRPGMSSILERAPEIDVVVCFDIDRFARDFAPFYVYERSLQEHNVTIEYVSHNFDDSASGELQRDIPLTFAKFERKKIRERSMRGRIGMAKSGKIPMVGRGEATYGYIYDKGEYLIHSERAEVVRMIYRWCVEERLGSTAIAKRLTDEGIPTPRKFGSGQWTYTAVNRILSDTTYIGRYYYNKTQHINGKTKPRPQKDWIEVAVPAIVDEVLFATAQRQREKNRRRPSRQTKSFYLMRGRMTCAQCGHNMLITSITNNEKRTYWYYYCAGQIPRLNPGWEATCHGYMSIKRLDTAVWAVIRDFLEDENRIRETLLLNVQEDTTGSRLSTLQKEIDSLESQQAKLLDLYLADTLPRDLLDQKHHILADKMVSLRSAHEQIKSQQRPHLTPNDVENIVARIRTIKKGIANATDEQKEFVMEMLQIEAVYDRLEGIIRLEGLLPSLEVHIEGNGHTSSSTSVSLYTFSLVACIRS